MKLRAAKNSETQVKAIASGTTSVIADWPDGTKGVCHFTRAGRRSPTFPKQSANVAMRQLLPKSSNRQGFPGPVAPHKAAAPGAPPDVLPLPEARFVSLCPKKQKAPFWSAFAFSRP
jgi:hypothetical protein